MCSRNADKTGSEAVRDGTARVSSITQRLTLLYVASTAALLLLAAGFLYWTLKRNMDATRHGMLASKIEVLRVLLRDSTQADVLASEVEHEAAASQPLRYCIRILDEQHVLLETSGMDEILPTGIFPRPQDWDGEPMRQVERVLQAYGSFLLLSVRVRPDAAGRETRILQIGLDVSAGLELLSQYRRTLLGILGLGIVFAAVAGVWVARQGMRPLAEITRAARQITASQLHERIGASRWPSELADLAGAFDAMLDRLEDSFTRLSQFSADLAHELRTPINNLRGEAEVALARSRTTDEYQQLLGSSLEECDRLSRMIDGLLFLARADDPGAGVERIRFDAREEIEAVREFYDALAREQDVEVTCEGSAWITGDPSLFRRAVSNGLANALQHTPAHGHVWIAVRTSAANRIEVSVRDTGIGIDPDHLPRVFDRFYRAGPRSKSAGGTGLGLAIVQSIMRLHGGSATMQSTPGTGTVLILSFPPIGCRALRNESGVLMRKQG